jgi:hypothetical protein
MDCRIMLQFLIERAAQDFNERLSHEITPEAAAKEGAL